LTIDDSATVVNRQTVFNPQSIFVFRPLSCYNPGRDYIRES